MAYQPKKLLLKAIPEDVYAELIKAQFEQKKKYDKQISLEAMVYRIIKSTIKQKA